MFVFRDLGNVCMQYGIVAHNTAAGEAGASNQHPVLRHDKDAFFLVFPCVVVVVVVLAGALLRREGGQGKVLRHPQAGHVDGRRSTPPVIQHAHAVLCVLCSVFAAAALLFRDQPAVMFRCRRRC